MGVRFSLNATQRVLRVLQVIPFRFTFLFFVVILKNRSSTGPRLTALACGTVRQRTGQSIAVFMFLVMGVCVFFFNAQVSP